MKFVYYLFFTFCFWNCANKTKSSTPPIAEDTQELLEVNKSKIDAIKIYSFNQFKSLLEKENDTTYVINFWATWCKPCVEELPAFEKLHAEIGSKKMKVILVSLDFPSEVNKQLIPFIRERNLQPEVIVLNDPDTNSWIPKIDKKWTGAIPATLFYNNNKRAFYEESFDYKKLHSVLKNFEL